MVAVIIGSIIKGLLGALRVIGIPLMMFFSGKKSAHYSRLKKEAKDAKESGKIKDGISRSDDTDLDDILHD